MPPSSVALRSLALALLGLGAASAEAQSQNVTAFNPYNGVGLAGGTLVVAAANMRTIELRAYASGADSDRVEILAPNS